MQPYMWVIEDGRKAKYVEASTRRVVGQVYLAATHRYGEPANVVEWWHATTVAGGFLGEYMGFEAAVVAVEKAVQP